jgi:hypothetical protein
MLRAVHCDNWLLRALMLTVLMQHVLLLSKTWVKLGLDLTIDGYY